MQSEDLSQLDRELDEALAEAQSGLAESRAAREKAGFGGDEALAKLESQLSPEDVAQVNAQVQAEMERIDRDIRFRSAQRGQSGTTSAQLRKSRQMI